MPSGSDCGWFREPQGSEMEPKMEPNPSPKWCRQAVPEADLVFNHFPADFQQKTFKILIIARCSENVKFDAGQPAEMQYFSTFALPTYWIRRLQKCHPKILQNRLQNQWKINVGSLCKVCSSTCRSSKGLRRHFRALGSPKWCQHGAKRAPKMEPKSMPKSISS